MSKRDFEEEFEEVNDEDFEDEDFEDEDFEDDDDDFEDDDEDCSEEDEDYLPTSEVIIQLLDQESEYANEAANIIEEWYKAESMLGVPLFEDEDDFLNNGREDLLDLADGHNAIMSDEDVHKCHVVWMALEGYDPYEEEE